MDIRPLSTVCGAEVIGLDCSSSIDDAGFAQLREALVDHSVLVFRDQDLTPEQHVSFSALWGSLKGHLLLQYLMPGQNYILVVSNKRGDSGQPLGIEDAGRYWHSDVSYENIPPMGSLLYGLEIPQSGGDTLFANQYQAYANLPDELKARIAKMKARHRFNYVQIQESGSSNRAPLSEDQKAQLVGAVHPVVRTHPESGRKALYVNPGFTEALLDEDDNADQSLLDTLFGYATDPSVIYRHIWQLHDLVFWDNRCLMHHATPYPESSVRHMHRTTVAGTIPV
ncbi:MAG: TauD/TfdA dioxygenase family protein [Rhodospirillaceae bacterium]